MNGESNMEAYTVPCVKQITNGILLYGLWSSNQASDNLEGWTVGGRLKREGTHVYLWLTHVDVWQRPTQNCKVIFFQLKINKFGVK